MTQRLSETLSFGKKLLLAAIGAAVVAGLVVFGVVNTPLTAQSSTAQAPTAQSPTPQWQIDAGGKMSFDVASVKQDTAAPSAQTMHTNIPLGPQDLFTPTGGLFSATNFPLIVYMTFAYKLTPDQIPAIMSKLPRWTSTDRFDIQARVEGNPTKDQFRLMMQALLADRFKLTVHNETRQLPVFALVLDKPGKLGPQIRPHPEDSQRSTAQPPPGLAPTIAGGFPEPCGGVVAVQPSAPGRLRAGARNMSMSMIATSLSVPQLTSVDRPILDKTGLAGQFDFIIEFTPQLNGPLPPGCELSA